MFSHSSCTLTLYDNLMEEGGVGVEDEKINIRMKVAFYRNFEIETSSEIREC